MRKCHQPSSSVLGILGIFLFLLTAAAQLQARAQSEGQRGDSGTSRVLSQAGSPVMAVRETEDLTGHSSYRRGVGVPLLNTACPKDSGTCVPWPELMARRAAEACRPVCLPEHLSRGRTWVGKTVLLLFSQNRGNTPGGGGRGGDKYSTSHFLPVPLFSTAFHFS